jgi:hypothetical protein
MGLCLRSETPAPRKLDQEFSEDNPRTQWFANITKERMEFIGKLETVILQREWVFSKVLT